MSNTMKKLIAWQFAMTLIVMIAFFIALGHMGNKEAAIIAVTTFTFVVMALAVLIAIASKLEDAPVFAVAATASLTLVVSMTSAFTLKGAIGPLVFFAGVLAASMGVLAAVAISDEFDVGECVAVPLVAQCILVVVPTMYFFL